MSDQSRTVARVVREQLEVCGFDTIFTLAGDTIVPLLQEFANSKRMSVVGTRHEEAAALMASAYAKLTGKPAVCLTDGGPGAVHLINGLYDAYTDCVPVLALTGQVEKKYMYTRHVQFFDQPRLFSNCTAYSATVVHPDHAGQLVRRAYSEAVVKARPAHLGFPKDLLMAQTGAEVYPSDSFQNPAPFPSSNDLSRAVDRLLTAKKPVIMAGRGSEGMGEKILGIAEKLEAGVIVTLPAKGTVPEDHPLVLGCLGDAGNSVSRDILAQSDVTLVIGATWWPEGYTPDNINVVQIDRSSLRVSVNFPAVISLTGDSKDVLPVLEEQMYRSSKPDWREVIQRAKEVWERSVEREFTATSVPIMPQRIIRSMEEAVPEDAIIAVDTGDHTLWFGERFRAKRQRILVSGQWRTMGWGLPAALAAKVADGERKVVALVGDGGFTQTMGELLTAVQYGLPIVVLVANNGSLALERHKQIKQGYDPDLVDLHNPDFAAYAVACGATGIKVDDPELLTEKITEALDADEPVVIDIDTEALAPPSLRLS